MAAETPTIIEGAVHINGALSAKSFTPPAGSIANASIAANAGIDATKLGHQHRANFSQPNTAATTETRVIYTVYGATATLVAFKAGSIAPATGNATVTLDLRKNGATVLTAVVTLNSSNAARVVVAGVLASTSLAQGDVIEVVITATAGTGTLPTGVFGYAEVREDAQ